MEDARIRQVRREDLTPAETAAIRVLLWAAFAGDEDGGMTEDDWRHAQAGGVHFLAETHGATGDPQAPTIVAYAAVVERPIHVGGRPLRTGYVEAVATAPGHQRRGIGRRVMEAVNAHIRAGYELGVLGTGVHSFYERLGWRTWRGPSFVRTAAGEQATPDEDGYIMVLQTPATPPLDPRASISCDPREGDAW